MGPCTHASEAGPEPCAAPAPPRGLAHLPHQLLPSDDHSHGGPCERVKFVQTVQALRRHDGRRQELTQPRARPRRAPLLLTRRASCRHGVERNALATRVAGCPGPQAHHSAPAETHFPAELWLRFLRGRVRGSLLSSSVGPGLKEPGEPGLLSVCPRRLPWKQTLGVGEGHGNPQGEGQDRPGWAPRPQLPRGPRPPLATSTDQSEGAAVPDAGDPSPGAGRGQCSGQPVDQAQLLKQLRQGARAPWGRPAKVKNPASLKPSPGSDPPLFPPSSWTLTLAFGWTAGGSAARQPSPSAAGAV